MDNTFSIRKGENVSRQTSSKDSITLNLGKSATSFSESDVNFSLTLRFTTDHKVKEVCYK